MHGTLYMGINFTSHHLHIKNDEDEQVKLLGNDSDFYSAHFLTKEANYR